MLDVTQEEFAMNASDDQTIEWNRCSVIDKSLNYIYQQHTWTQPLFAKQKMRVILINILLSLIVARLVLKY